MSGKLTVWLWVSVATVIAGAFLLYPIGTAALDVVFVLVKLGMLFGLCLLLLFKRAGGFYVWAGFCAGAVIMTVTKWTISGKASFIIIASIIVDMMMPIVAYALMKKEPD